MRTYTAALMIVFSASLVRAEVPKSFQELSYLVTNTILSTFLKSSKTFLSANVSMLTICRPDSPLPAYNFDCEGCEVPLTAKYIDADGSCFEQKMSIIYRADFSNLQVATFAQIPWKHGEFR